MIKELKPKTKAIKPLSATMKKDYQKAFEKVFMSAPQRNPANSGKNYNRPYKKTKIK